MSVPRAVFLIHACVVGRVEKYFLNLVNYRYYNTRYNLQLILLNDSNVASPEMHCYVSSTTASKYKYDLDAGLSMV